MGFFDRKIRQLAEEEQNDNVVNIAKATSDKAVEVIAELSGKKYTQGKKLIDNLLLFTGASGGTGVSTVLSNVAFAFKQVGLSVIIVDLNIMCPIQHTFLGIEQKLDKKDLVSCINGGADIAECIESEHDIHLLFANNRAINDDLVCNEKLPVENFSNMLKHLRNYYDVVLIDCPMRMDNLLINQAIYEADAIYNVWDEGIASIINTDKVRRNLGLTGIDSYTKMRVIVNKRTDVSLSKAAINRMNLEVVGVLPFSTDVIDNSLRGKIFCDKGAATNRNGKEFAEGIEKLSTQILRISGYNM